MTNQKKEGTHAIHFMGGHGDRLHFLMTTLGAAMVFLFRKQLNASIQRIFLGFAAGV